MRTLFVIILIILSLLSCKKERFNSTMKEEIEEGIYNVKITQKNYEQKSFELFAREISYFHDTSFADDVKVVFFNPEGDTSSILFADKGWYVDKTGNVGVSGNVRIFATRGDTLLTDTLLYVDSTHKIIAPSRVVIYRNGEKILGKNLKSDLEFKKVIIGGKVIGKRSQ